MTLELKRIPSTGKYTLKEEVNGEKTVKASPMKYSFQDKYAKYRRIEKYGKF